MVLAIQPVVNSQQERTTSHYRFEFSQNSVKSTVRSEIDQFRAKLGVGGNFFRVFLIIRTVPRFLFL